MIQGNISKKKSARATSKKFRRVTSVNIPACDSTFSISNIADRVNLKVIWYISTPRIIKFTEFIEFFIMLALNEKALNEKA